MQHYDHGARLLTRHASACARCPALLYHRAGAMLGMSNVSGALAGILGVSAVGLLLDASDSWGVALYAPNAVLLLAGAACYAALCKNDPIDFDSRDNSRSVVPAGGGERGARGNRQSRRGRGYMRLRAAAVALLLAP